MKPSASSFAARLGAALALLAGAASLPACAFDDGQPWGRLDLTAAARVDAPAARVAAPGVLKTTHNYLVTLEAVDVTPTALAVSQAAAGATLTFDPADPPEGYSLCHNGHCHADDGRLVAYEEIAAELAGGAAAQGATVSVPVSAGATLPVGTALGASVPLALEACPGGCAFGRGDLAALSGTVASVHLRGVVHDQREGDAARLPAEGRAFDVTLDGAWTLTAPLSGAFDKDEPVGLRLAATLVVPPALFDAVDWQLDDTAAIEGALFAAFGEDAAVEVEASRFD